MSIRSMTAYAQVRATHRPNDADSATAFAVSLKSVNHRYLDLQMRMPAETDALEMKLRRLLKEKLARGHVDLTLSFERGQSGTLNLNRDVVGAYIEAYRRAAEEFEVNG